MMMTAIKRLAASATLLLLGGAFAAVSGFPSAADDLVVVDPEATDGNCVHKFPAADDNPHPVHLESRHRVVKRSPEHQLRVKVFYDDTVERLPKSKKKIVEEVRRSARMVFNLELSNLVVPQLSMGNESDFNSGGAGRGQLLGEGAEGAAHGGHSPAEPQVREQPVLPLARRPHAGTLFNMKLA